MTFAPSPWHYSARDNAYRIAAERDAADARAREARETAAANAGDE